MMQDVASLPAPEQESVQCKEQPGGIYAAVSFSGQADEAQVQQQLAHMRAGMAQDGLTAVADTYVVARYNDPSTKPIFRRNDILIPVSNFQLWVD